MDDHYDLIVIGGGPAGSTAATLVAREGHRVLLLERDEFPRFRIGESLMPATYWSLKRLGVLDRMPSLGSPRKHSVQFFLKDGRATAPFYFSSVDGHESSVTWQVDRSAFDRMLLEHAAESGVAVRQPTVVRDVLFDGDRAIGVRAAAEDGAEREIGASVVVDATGQSALLARRLGLTEWDPGLRNASLYARYRGAVRDPGRDEGATLIFHTEDQDSWFWYIPLPEDLVSVGVVGSMDYLIRTRSADRRQVFEEELAICPALQPRLRDAERVGGVRAVKDFSYHSRRIAGDGWILTGDAFGFLDPIYSSGVFLALKSAEFAAEAILDALEAGDFSAVRLGRHGDEYVAGMEALRRLIYAYYDRRFSFTEFLQRFPERREDLTHLLIGDVFRRSPSGLIEDLEQMLTIPDYRPFRLSGEEAS